MGCCQCEQWLRSYDKVQYALLFALINVDKIDWPSLSENPNAIHLIEANLDKIIWETIWENPSIFMCTNNLDIRMIIFRRYIII